MRRGEGSTRVAKSSDPVPVPLPAAAGSFFPQTNSELAPDSSAAGPVHTPESAMSKLEALNEQRRFEHALGGAAVVMRAQEMGGGKLRERLRAQKEEAKLRAAAREEKARAAAASAAAPASVPGSDSDEVSAPASPPPSPGTPPQEEDVDTMERIGNPGNVAAGYKPPNWGEISAKGDIFNNPGQGTKTRSGGDGEAMPGFRGDMETDSGRPMEFAAVDEAGVPVSDIGPGVRLVNVTPPRDAAAVNLADVKPALPPVNYAAFYGGLGGRTETPTDVGDGWSEGWGSPRTPVGLDSPHFLDLVHADVDAGSPSSLPKRRDVQGLHEMLSDALSSPNTGLDPVYKAWQEEQQLIGRSGYE